MPNLKETLLRTIDLLIDEGRAVVGTKFIGKRYATGSVSYVDIEPYYRWFAGLTNLARLLGKFGDAWQKVLTTQDTHFVNAMAQLGILQGIRSAVESDLLVTAESLIRAELFDDLLEQADYLLKGNFWLAAGTLGRAVLEEHLRKWCDVAKCMPVKSKPKAKSTLNDYNASLYAANIVDKLKVKHIESMAAVGNECAHNTGNATHKDVGRLLRDVRDFVVNNPV